jgi:hypothetical protein
MAGKGKNFGRHQKILQRPAASAAPSEPKITLQQIQDKRNIPKSQTLVDLDHAEDISLKLLEICANTTDQFAAMAGGDMGGAEPTGLSESADERNDGSISDGKNSSMSTSSSTSNEEQHRITKIQKNGIEFRAKLAKIHDLLSPHAHLVVNYSNLEEMKRIDNLSPDSSQVKTNVIVGGGVEDDAKEGDSKAHKTKNMYTSRLEVRLAIERKNVLRNLLKLEKERQIQNNLTKEGITLQKRKRED